MKDKLIQKQKELIGFLFTFIDAKNKILDQTLTNYLRYVELKSEIAELEKAIDEQQPAKTPIEIHNRIVAYTNNVAMVDHKLYVKAEFLVKAMESYHDQFKQQITLPTEEEIKKMG